jgi:uncharacterized membrane protein YagU involved in acid resistance
MNRFQDVWLALSSDNSSTQKEDSNPDDHDGSNVKTQRSSDQTRNPADGNEDDATVKAATATSEIVLGHKLTTDEKKIAGTVVHYAVGATAGIAYSVAAEFKPGITTRAGLPYGTAFWLAVDEGLVPLLRLSKAPTAYPLATHLYALVSHLVFGATAEGVRRMLRQ